MSYTVFETLSRAAGVGVTVINTRGDARFRSSLGETCAPYLEELTSALGCAEADRVALIYGCRQARRFGGRNIFFTPAGLTYCASPLDSGQDDTEAAVAGPFLMTDCGAYADIDILDRHTLSVSAEARLRDAIHAVPQKTPAEARAINEQLFVCAMYHLRITETEPSEPRQTDAFSYSAEKEDVLLAAVSRGDGQAFDYAKAKHADVIYKAMSFMKKRYSEKISLRDIAGSVFMNVTYFSKIFKDETGQTPGSYLSAVRIEESRRLLRDISVNISDIPEMIGLESQSYFTQVFRKSEGCTPGVFRRKTVGRGDGNA
ncbi:MAG: helix-turn-helix domain-containing protein [Oscillospiraceae bacterium]|jgi:AraC-like DNA-binding protein|nr:helix-turn-helix domain-containing protein [Oscillospiraceae bacterium]